MDTILTRQDKAILTLQHVGRDEGEEQGDDRHVVPQLVNGEDALQHHAGLGVADAGHDQARAVTQGDVILQYQGLEMFSFPWRLGYFHLGE